MIRKGRFGIDDYIKFGELIDMLSNFSYSITLLPGSSEVFVTARRNSRVEVESIIKGRGLEITKKSELGGLAFFRFRW